MGQSTSPSLVLSLPALTAVAVLSLPDYSGGPWEWGQTDPHQPTLDPPLPSGVNLTNPSEILFSLSCLGEMSCCLTTHVLFEGSNEAAKVVS